MQKEQRHSNIDWIGNIPKHWRTEKVKHGFTRKNEKAEQEDPVVLSLARSGVRVRDLSNNDGQIAESYYNYNPVAPGDLLLNPMDLYSGANCSFSEVEGVISPAYINLRANEGYDPLYYDYYFKIQYWMMAFFAHGKGVSFENRWTLSAETLLNYPIIVPPVEEQHRIAAYLKQECNRVDVIIGQTRNSIEEYKGLRQRIISHAVTKGVRGNRKQQVTGVEWVGAIPCDWDCTKLKYFVTLRSGITLGKTYPKDAELIEVPYLRVANVQGSYVDLSNVTTLSVLPEEIEKYRLHAGEVLMTEGGDRDKLGRGCVWNGELDPCLHQNHVFAVTTDEEKMLGQFLAYMTASSVARTYFDITAKKTTNLACTNSTTILNFIMPIPPVEEQREIVEYLDKKCAEMDVLIAKKEQFLTELENYKKSLIYEYVTGKKEVQ